MAIVRFDPFRELAALQGNLRGDGGWVPAVDIYETADRALVIKAELPEMTREAIAVTVEHGTLTISGERALPVGVKARGLPARGAVVRQVQPPLRAASVGRRFEGGGRIQGRRAQRAPAAARRVEGAHRAGGGGVLTW